MHVNAYENYLRQSGYSNNTLYSYMSQVKKLADWLSYSAGEFEPKYWTREWVEEYLQWLGRKHTSASMLTHAQKTLRVFFAWAVSENLIEKNPVAKNTPRPSNIFDSQYCEWLIEQGKNRNTVRSYNAQIYQFANWFEEHTGEVFSPEKITSLDVNKYLKYLKDSSFKPATINSQMFSLRSYLNYAVDKRFIKDSPFIRLNGVAQQLEAKKTRWLESRQQYEFMRRVEEKISRRGYLEYTVMLVLLDAGLRNSEVCNLKMDHVKLYPVKEAHIEVLHSKWNRSRSVPIASTSKGEGKRLHKALKSYLEERERNEKAKNQPWFFVNTQGRQLTPRLIQNMFKHYRNGDRITAHILRHSFGHNLTEGGMLLHEVAELMGHMRSDGSPNLQTVTIYTMSSEAEKRKKLNDILI